MPDYTNGKIYKVICSESQKIYIGSSTQPLYKRLYGHKQKGNTCVSKCFINPTIVLIEKFSCQNKEELTKRERYYIDTLDCVNKIRPGRSKKEYYQDNKDKIKEYYQDNKEKILEYNKQYKLDNKDEIKQYKLDNKDKIAEQGKQYYQDNREKNKIKIDCQCGGCYTYGHRKRHERTKKHITHIHNQEGGN